MKSKNLIQYGNGIQMYIKKRNILQQNNLQSTHYLCHKCKRATEEFLTNIRGWK